MVNVSYDCDVSDVGISQVKDSFGNWDLQIKNTRAQKQKTLCALMYCLFLADNAKVEHERKHDEKCSNNSCYLCKSCIERARLVL